MNGLICESHRPAWRWCVSLATSSITGPKLSQTEALSSQDRGFSYNPLFAIQFWFDPFKSDISSSVLPYVFFLSFSLFLPQCSIFCPSSFLKPLHLVTYPRAVINNYIHYRLRCQLFSWVIHWLIIWFIECQKLFKNAITISQNK